MQLRILNAAACAALLSVTSGAFAQSNVSPVHQFSWGENIGYMNWRDAGSPITSRGALIAGTFLSGYIWCENVGYLNLGDGTPFNGTRYTNMTGADFGVNLLVDRQLGGLAWGENVGWVNFGPFASLPMNQHARYDRVSGRLRGYAWGENIGWINLDDSSKFVATICPADFNNDAVVDFFDYLDFVQAFAANQPIADFNHDAVIDFFDYLDFVQAFSSGC